MTDFKPQRRRFIAGAVCPRCSAMDKIVIDLDSDLRECVACDFKEGRPEAGPVAATPVGVPELPTRVSRAAARRVETPAEVITLLETGKKVRKPDAT